MELQIEETMAKLPHTERQSSSELEDGDSTDMGYASNGENNVGCMSCSPCCYTKKDKSIKQANGQNNQIKKPSSLFGEKSFNQVCRETQKKSEYGKVLNYGLVSVIVKSPDDLT